VEKKKKVKKGREGVRYNTEEETVWALIKVQLGSVSLICKTE
jgi:hypothetical protein